MTTTPEPPIAIDVRGAGKRYGDFVALDDVSLQVPTGGLTALLGPSGGGKSTLLRIIAGLTPPDTGSIRIDGVDVTRLPARERGIGFVFQHYAAFKHMSVFENIAFGLRIRRQKQADVVARVNELLHLVHLEGFADRRPSQLSGGQRQRMALARALAIEPRVLLLDEPFGALDAKVRAELREWLRDLHDRMHVTTVFVTHDQQEALELAERIVLVNHGRVEQSGHPEELYERPASPFVMGFVGEVTRLGGQFVRPDDIEISREPVDGARPAVLDRVVRLGFGVRLELSALDPSAPGGPLDGERVSVQTTRHRVADWRLSGGDTLYLRPTRTYSFAPGADGEQAAESPRTPEPVGSTSGAV